MTAAELDRIGGTELTTRDDVVDRVAAGWLLAHPEVKVTPVNLAKTTQQLITEIFDTAGRRQRRALTGHAVAVLHAAGLAARDFAPVRSFSKSADMSAAYGAMIGAVAAVLAPVAAAVELARIPVTNAAARRLDPGEAADRRQLRGFVVAQVRPHARNLHDQVGAGESAQRYLGLILADVDSLAVAVVESARSKNARPTRLDADAAEQMNSYARTHLKSLIGYAAVRFGQDADDIVGAALVKLAVQFRNRPGRVLGYSYGRDVVDSAAKDFFLKRKERQSNETSDPEALDRVAETADESAGVEGFDLTLRTVMGAMARLAGGPRGSDGWAAREVLQCYFLDEPQESDPRRARLNDRALHLESDGGDLRGELTEVADTLGFQGSSSDRITAVAIAALGAQARDLLPPHAL